MKDIIKVALDEAFPKVKKAAAKKLRSKASEAKKAEIVIDDCVIEEVSEVIPVKFVVQIPSQTIILAIEADHSIKEFQSPQSKCSGFRIPTKSIKSSYKAHKVQEVEEISEEVSEAQPEMISTESSTETEFICEEAPEVQEDDFWAKCA